MTGQLEKFWTKGEAFGKMEIKTMFKFEVLVPLRSDLRTFVAALEKGESLECVPLILERINNLIADLKEKRFITENLNKALEYGKQHFKGKKEEEEGDA